MIPDMKSCLHLRTFHSIHTYIGKLKDAKDKVFLWDPSTLDYFGEIPVMNADEVKTIVDKARIAQEEWKQSSFNTRKMLMRVMLRYITENKDICGM